jgi:GTP-binding protein
MTETTWTEPVLPVVAVVGRPNVGKSMLVNRIIGRREAVVQDLPGVTRDRVSYDAEWNGRDFVIVDTGGWAPDAKGMAAQIAEQAELAIAAADVVLFVVDATVGTQDIDESVVEVLRRSRKPVVLAANKVDDLRQEADAAAMWNLGLGEPYAVSAMHGRGTGDLLDALLAVMPDSPAVEEQEVGGPRRVAIIGRPNVGKSSLLNSLLGEERSIVSAIPGTTRDAIDTTIEWGRSEIVLIDTAGIRRRGKVFEAIEKFSVIKTLQAIEDANVVVLLLDADHAITEQDAHLAGHILEAGRALVVGINKWDAAAPDQREDVKREIGRKLGFLSFAQQHFISARDGRGVGAVMKSVGEAFAAAMVKLPTPRLTRTLQLAVARQQPPRAGLVRPKLRYAHQGGVNPPLIIVHGTALQHIPDAYRRYLEHFFSDAFQLRGTPLRIQFKVGANPYA